MDMGPRSHSRGNDTEKSEKPRRLVLLLVAFRSRYELEDVSRLALQGAAQRIQSREPDCPSFVGLEDRQVCERDVDALRQFGQTDLAVEHDAVEIEFNHRPSLIWSARSRP